MILTIQKEQFTKTKIGPSEKQPFTYYTKKKPHGLAVCGFGLRNSKFGHDVTSR